jgi:ring-1,2-phenylacetyl-CoA epoxidase subunit PaaE
MGLFKSRKEKKNKKAPRGFSMQRIRAIERLSSDTVKVVFDIESNPSFSFEPGQYINVSIHVDGEEQRRSYSICSGKDEPLAIAVKEVEKGTVSRWFNQQATPDMEIAISAPEGNFTKPKDAKNIVGIAAGSGITPIMALAKATESTGGTLRLFFGNRTEDDILFRSEIDTLQNTSPIYFLSREEKEGFEHGRITKQALIDAFKADLSLLRSDGFFLCGPEEMIVAACEALEMFGVSKEKIHYELFTTPVLMKSEETVVAADFKGSCEVTVTIDGEEETFTMDASRTILEAALEEGLDAPYSCRGGVCSTCKAKVTEGAAKMSVNYALTDQEVEEGFVLTCMAHPASESVKIDYDDL